MGVLLSYSIITGIVLAFCYPPYRWIMANGQHHAFNRLSIFSIYILSLLSPIFIFNYATHRSDFGNIVASEIPNSRLSISNGGLMTENFHIWEILVIVYAIGIVCVSVSYLSGIAKILLIIKRSHRVKGDGYDVAVSGDDRISPFNWRNTVVMNQRTYESKERPIVLAHEVAHIKKRHWVDLAVAQIMVSFLWYNPIVWIFRNCLKELHEFQADESVLKLGVNPLKYHLFLVSSAFSSKFNLPTDFLNAGNIRRRIHMMNKNKNARIKRIAIVFIVPFVTGAIFACRLEPINLVIKQIHDVNLTFKQKHQSEYLTSIAESMESSKKISKDETIIESEHMVGDFVDAEFTGGQMALMKFLTDNVKYPKEAEANRIQGKVLVSFELSEYGDVVSIGIKESVAKSLDDEALRVCRKITKFKPATLNGTPVSSTYILPITFEFIPNL